MPCLLCPEYLNEEDILFSNKYCLFLLRPFSNLAGAGHILPKEHKESVFDLTPKELASTFSLLKDVKAYLEEKYSPQGYQLGWDCGKVAGQIVPHAHFHVIPRYRDEPFAEKGITHWIEKDENRRCAFKEEKELLDNLKDFFHLP